MKHHKESYCPRQACQFSYNLAAALHYLHSFRIIHRDIKPENLLVYSYPDETKILKICDFGLATEVRRSEKLSFICGTATYVAPEIITGNGYGVEVDIWAAGIIIYILLCGFPPFRSESGDQDDLFRIILRGEFEFPSPFWDDVDEEAKDLIIRILNQNTGKRQNFLTYVHFLTSQVSRVFQVSSSSHVSSVFLRLREFETVSAGHFPKRCREPA